MIKYSKSYLKYFKLHKTSNRSINFKLLSQNEFIKLLIFFTSASFSSLIDHL